MPLPLIIIPVAAALGVTGVGASILGIKKLGKAHKKNKEIKARHNDNIQRFEQKSIKTSQTMDELGKLELEILQSFKTFSDLIEQIQNRPQFKEHYREGIELPKYDKEELRQVWLGAGVLLGGMSGAAIGTAGGFAAAGATTAAVMSLGTASTGTAIASLSGAAAVNATLAALGGGALAAGGGGIALGTAVLGTATAGVGILIGGIIFNFAGKKLSDQVEEAECQMLEAEETMSKIGIYLEELNQLATDYTAVLNQVNTMYQCYLEKLNSVICLRKKTNWEKFTNEEKIMTENTVRFVGLLYKMCQVKLVLEGETKDEKETNAREVRELIDISEKELLAGI